MSKTKATAPANEPTIIMERWIDASPEAVYAAFSTAEAIAQWWGPFDAALTVHQMDFRVGGITRFTMHAPDGGDYLNRVTYRELVPGRLISLRMDGGEDGDPMAFEMRVELAAEGGGALVRIHSIFPSMEARAAVMQFGAVELGQKTWDKLAAWTEGRS